MDRPRGGHEGGEIRPGARGLRRRAEAETEILPPRRGARLPGLSRRTGSVPGGDAEAQTAVKAESYDEAQGDYREQPELTEGPRRVKGGDARMLGRRSVPGGDRVRRRRPRHSAAGRRRQGYGKVFQEVKGQQPAALAGARLPGRGWIWRCAPGGGGEEKGGGVSGRDKKENRGGRRGEETRRGRDAFAEAATHKPKDPAAATAGRKDAQDELERAERWPSWPARRPPTRTP